MNRRPAKAALPCFSLRYCLILRYCSPRTTKVFTTSRRRFLQRGIGLLSGQLGKLPLFELPSSLLRCGNSRVSMVALQMSSNTTPNPFGERSTTAGRVAPSVRPRRCHRMKETRQNLVSRHQRRHVQHRPEQGRTRSRRPGDRPDRRQAARAVMQGAVPASPCAGPEAWEFRRRRRACGDLRLRAGDNPPAATEHEPCM